MTSLFVAIKYGELRAKVISHIVVIVTIMQRQRGMDLFGVGWGRFFYYANIIFQLMFNHLLTCYHVSIFPNKINDQS